MPEEIKNNDAVTPAPATGSTPAPIATVGNPNKFDDANKGSAPAGKPESDASTVAKATEEMVSKKLYEDLQSEFGRQGAEVGDLRKFFEDVRPLMDILNENPTIVQAIASGQITTDLAKAVMEGKVTIQDAEAVNKAHEQVKKDLGAKYQESKPEEIEKLVSTKVAEAEAKLTRKFEESQEEKKFKDNIESFVSQHDDFPQYAQAIDQWFDEHPEQTDISVAYRVVKSEIKEKEETSRKEVEKAEAAKAIASNATAGSGNAGGIISGANASDQFIGHRPNPNIFD